ncbi:MAG: hypothetical protein ACXWV2_04525 [Chitinophagaceae bacterium]
MQTDNISEIGIDDNERLFIKPETKNFEFIYRVAAEVTRNNKEKFLFSPKPKESTYFDWFRQIIIVTKDEYGCQLILTDKTKWTNIPDELKSKICEDRT